MPASSLDILRRELALRRKLLELGASQHFRQYLLYTNPTYQLMWYHAVIADYCQMLLEGKIKNLMIFVAPQHGKSEIVSRKFPSWAHGINPDLKIIASSYSDSLVTGFSMNIQRTIESEEYQRIFSGTWLNGMRGRTLRGYKRNEDYFDIVEHRGFYKAVSVGKGLTGTPVDIAIIDDPVKDAAMAYSATHRERIWDWYNSVLTTRLHNESKQLFIMTRWHEDDLAGRILAVEPDEWTVLSIPAICEVRHDGGLSKREIGDALWPERHSLEKLQKQQARSARVFSALYQQHPTADGGNIIKSAWFRKATVAEFEKKHRGEPIIFFLDTAFTEKTANDPSGIIATCKIGNDLYITHAEKFNLNFPHLIRRLPEYVRAHGYTSGSTIRIEPKANGISVIDELKDKTDLNVTRTPVPKDSKETRLNVAAPSVEGGHVYLVDGQWNDAFIDEVCGFPVKPHDEFADVLGYAIDYHLTNPFKPIDKKRLARLAY